MGLCIFFQYAGWVGVSFIVEKTDSERTVCTVGKDLCCNFLLGCRLIRDVVGTVKQELPCVTVWHILCHVAKREVLF